MSDKTPDALQALIAWQAVEPHRLWSLCQPKANLFRVTMDRGHRFINGYGATPMEAVVDAMAKYEEGRS